MLLAVCNDPPNCTQGVNPFSGYADNNLIVDHNIFRGNSRFCDAWDATWGGTYGTCSANSFVTCPDSTQCHGDCIHSWGERGSTFSNNQFLHCATQAFFLEESSGGANVSGTIENNYFTKLQTEGAQAGFGGGTGSHGIWGGWCADSCFGHPTGTWNIRYNTAIGTADVGVDLGCSVFGMQCHYGTSTINVVGNTGFAFYGNDSNTCTGGSEAGNGNPNTLTYAYHANVWTSDSDPHVNSGIPDTCDATDSAVTRATATGWYNDANPPTLNTSANPPIGFVGTGATYCTGTDYNGHARSGSTCNAGLLNQ
jgi:hypothetical protein